MGAAQQMLLGTAPAGGGFTYATLNPADLLALSLSNGNRTATFSGQGGARATQSKTTGKWYFEVTLTGGAGGFPSVGIASSSYALSEGVAGLASQSAGYRNDGRLYVDGTTVSTFLATFTTGDVIGVAFDVDARGVSFYKNNVLQQTVNWAATFAVFPLVSGLSSGVVWVCNFGASTFVYPPPSGFNAGVYL
jgi:hypothetical protein